MKLSIVILNYKSKGFTRECVKGIQRARLPFDYEIIVVDNASGDGVCDMIASRFSGVTCIQNSKNLGMGAGNNVGFKAAKGEYIMVLNPDTVPYAESFVPLVEFLDTHPKTGIAAPKVLNPDKSYQPTVHKFPNILMPLWRRTPLGKTSFGKRYLAEYTIDESKLQKAQPVDWVFGPAFMIRKSVADQLGGYDERYFLTFEDTDLCREVWQAGYDVWYVPEAKIIHYPHRVSGHHLGIWSMFKKTTWHHINSWRMYFWKWRHKPVSR